MAPKSIWTLTSTLKKMSECHCITWQNIKPSSIYFKCDNTIE